jgi:hypothetical protein
MSDERQQAACRCPASASLTGQLYGIDVLVAAGDNVREGRFHALRPAPNG